MRVDHEPKINSSVGRPVTTRLARKGKSSVDKRRKADAVFVCRLHLTSEGAWETEQPSDTGCGTCRTTRGKAVRRARCVCGSPHP